jgi:cytochrome c
MLDQTSHDAQRKPLTITEESAWDLARYVYARSNPHESPQILLSAMEIKQIIEAAHGIKGDA